MSDFRKLLLAFVAVTLFAGIASAGPQPVLTTSAQPLSVRMEVLAPENMFSFDTGCNIGVTTPAFLVQSSGNSSTPFFPDNALLMNFGAPALTPAPNIVAPLNTNQTTLSGQTALAAGTTIAATPATLNPNSSNAALRHLSQTLNSTILNGTETNNTHFVAVDTGQMSDHPTVSNAFNAHTVAQPGQVVAPILAVPAVARTGPNNAGVNAG